ncbi:hypothetical protein ACQKWADRAFT_202907 [Trichoderma austrokoningii]
MAHLVVQPQHLKCGVAANHGVRKGAEMELVRVGGMQQRFSASGESLRSAPEQPRAVHRSSRELEVSGWAKQLPEARGRRKWCSQAILLRVEEPDFRCIGHVFSGSHSIRDTKYL